MIIVKIGTEIELEVPSDVTEVNFCVWNKLVYYRFLMHELGGDFSDKLSTIPFLEALPVKPAAGAIIGFLCNQGWYALAKSKKKRGAILQELIDNKD